MLPGLPLWPLILLLVPLRDFARLRLKLGTDSKKLRRLPWQSLASDFPEQLLPNIDYSSLDGWHRGFFQRAARICQGEAEPAWAAWHLWIGFPVKGLAVITLSSLCRQHRVTHQCITSSPAITLVPHEKVAQRSQRSYVVFWLTAVYRYVH